MKVLLLVLFLASSAFAQDDLRLSRTNAGVVRPLPVDTLIVDGKRIIGTAVPARAVYLPGDINCSGDVTLADAMSLLYHVLMEKPLPTGGDTVSIQVQRAFKGDTTLFTFVPRRAGTR